MKNQDTSLRQSALHTSLFQYYPFARKSNNALLTQLGYLATVNLGYTIYKN